jgi:hypothetical protein
MRGGTLKLVKMHHANAPLSNDFNAIVETNMSSKRAIEGIITNHPK